MLPLPRRIHFLGIHGRMVGGLAIALQRRGVTVSGTDHPGFPPMPGLLQKAGIPVSSEDGDLALPDKVEAVITGALTKRGHPLLEAALDQKIPVWNAAAFLQHYFLRQTENLVVAGTKGKTSTTAMLLWILESAGRKPNFLLGGGLRGREQRLSVSGTPTFVLEGDEYPCGLGDPLPKFLRYHPLHLGVTTLRHDHLEIYRSAESYREAFVHLIHQVPRNGSITLNADDGGAASLSDLSPTPVTSVGFARSAAVRLGGFREASTGTQFQVGGVPFSLPLPGKMNARNAAIAAVLARHTGVPLTKSARALRTFPGVEGRLDLVAGDRRSRIYTDEAYHPLALRATLEAVRSRHPGRRLVLLFEPRYTGGAKGPWQQALPESIAESATLVLASPPVELTTLARPFSTASFCRKLQSLGVKAIAAPSLLALEAPIRRWCQPGDVVVISFSMIRGEESAHLCGVLREVLEIKTGPDKVPRG